MSNYVDIFFETQPTETIGLADSQLYAIKKVVWSGGTYWHALVTGSQYQWRLANGKSAVVWQDVCDSKAKFFKKIKDKNNKDKNCPVHVFGRHVHDPKGKKLILPSSDPDIALNAQPVIV